MLSVQGRNIASLPAEKHILYGEDFFLLAAKMSSIFFMKRLWNVPLRGLNHSDA